jgi:hypothetical protein
VGAVEMLCDAIWFCDLKSGANKKHFTNPAKAMTGIKQKEINT